MYVTKRAGRNSLMNTAESWSSNSFRYFVLGVLFVAVLLGIYFVRLNAQVDRAREATYERLALCSQVESVARSVLPVSLVTRDICEQSSGRISKSVTRP